VKPNKYKVAAGWGLSIYCMVYLMWYWKTSQELFGSGCKPEPTWGRPFRVASFMWNEYGKTLRL